MVECLIAECLLGFRGFLGVVGFGVRHGDSSIEGGATVLRGVAGRLMFEPWARCSSTKVAP